ncbi:unnamed protein product, partial [marine sediment metagenome]
DEDAVAELVNLLAVSGEKREHYQPSFFNYSE